MRRDHLRARNRSESMAKTMAPKTSRRESNGFKTPATPTDLSQKGVAEITASLKQLLADVFVLYLKTKNFHWHMSGAHFRDYHLLLDEQSEQIFDATDDIAERVRKIGGTTLRSIGHVARLQRIPDNDAEFVTPEDMLAELREDNKRLALEMRGAHAACEEH